MKYLVVGEDWGDKTEDVKCTLEIMARTLPLVDEEGGYLEVDLPVVEMVEKLDLDGGNPVKSIEEKKGGISLNTNPLVNCSKVEKSPIGMIRMGCVDKNDLSGVKCVPDRNIECDEDDEDGTKLEKAVPVKKKKIWTRLKNGLYGWRVRRVAKRGAKTETNSHGFEQGPLSAQGLKWVPALQNIQNIQTSSIQFKMGNLIEKRNFEQLMDGELEVGLERESDGSEDQEAKQLRRE